MTRDLEKEECEVLGIVRNVDLITSTLAPNLSPEIALRRKEIIKQRENDPNFFDGDKLGVEAVEILDGEGRIYITPRTYSQVVASRSIEPNKISPIDWMYTRLGNKRRGQLFVKNNDSMVNPLTQGVLVVSNPPGSRTPVGELPVIITVRGKNKYVVLPIEKYNYLRECELETALLETKKDIKEG